MLHVKRERETERGRERRKSQSDALCSNLSQAYVDFRYLPREGKGPSCYYDNEPKQPVSYKVGVVHRKPRDSKQTAWGLH